MKLHEAKIIESYKDGMHDYTYKKSSQASLLLQPYKEAYEQGWKDIAENNRMQFILDSFNLGASGCKDIEDYKGFITRFNEWFKKHFII